VNRLKAKEGDHPFFPLYVPSAFRIPRLFRDLWKESGERLLSSFSEEFRTFTRIQLMSWGNMHFDQLPSSLSARLLISEDPGRYGAGIDPAELEEEIPRRFSKWGGNIDEIEGVERIHWGWGKDVSITLAGDHRTCEARRLIFNSPLHSLEYLQGEGSKLLSKWRRRIQPLYVILPLFIGIR
jgi:hypothetical protein